MVKRDIVEMVRAALGTTKKEADAAIEAVLDAIVEGCILHGEVKLKGFGTFRVMKAVSRKVCVPNSDETRMTKPQKVMKFKSSRTLYFP